MDYKETYAKLTRSVLNFLLMALGLCLVGVLAILLADGILNLANLAIKFEEFETIDAKQFIDSLLIGLIVIEIFRNINAYLQGLSVIPVVIDVSILAVARQIILHRPESFDSTEGFLIVGATYMILMGILLLAYYVVKVKEPRKDLQEETKEFI